MNEELQKALGELLNKANNCIDAASGFLAAELPEVIYQLLMWHGVYNFILFIVSLLLIVTIPFQIKKITATVPDKIQEGDPDNFYWFNENLNYPSLGFLAKRTDISVASRVALGFAVFIEAIICLSSLNLEWLQIYIAPKVWLLEYAASLTK